ncbi:MAG TPA: hypothetical protein PLD27_07325 [bacterium]|nr:hypothetical protein [bacterium]HOL47464.1 hypothetical protein [bacterium]HPQ18944.1 hypothetical protein [bacterium]
MNNLHLIAIIILIIIIFLIVKRVKQKLNDLKKNDPENKLKKMNLKYLTDEQKEIVNKYGFPINVLTEESIEGITIIWIYKEKIIKFNKEGKILKIF